MGPAQCWLRPPALPRCLHGVSLAWTAARARKTKPRCPLNNQTILFPELFCDMCQCCAGLRHAALR
jgi:hypothetical protein